MRGGRSGEVGGREGVGIKRDDEGEGNHQANASSECPFWTYAVNNRNYHLTLLGVLT